MSQRKTDNLEGDLETKRVLTDDEKGLAVALLTPA